MVLRHGQPLRVGLVGVGRFGRAWLTTLQQSDEVELIFTCDPAGSEPSPPSAPHFEDLQSALDALPIEAAVVATPPSTHARVARELLRAGIAVLVEKPLTVSATSAFSLTTLAEQKRTAMLVNHTPCFQPAFRELLRQLATGRVGSLRGVASRRAVARRPGPAPREGMWAGARCPIWTLGPHDLALLGSVDVQLLRALSHRELGSGQVELHASQGGVSYVGVLSTTALAPSRRFAVIGDRGTLVLDEQAAERLTFLPSVDDPEVLQRTWGREPSSPLEAVSLAVEPSTRSPLEEVLHTFLAAAGRPWSSGAASDTLAAHVVEVLQKLRPYEEIPRAEAPPS